MLLPSFSSPPDVQASHRGRMEKALAAKCNKYSWEAGVCPRCFPQGLQVRRGAPGLALLHELPAMSRASTERAGLILPGSAVQAGLAAMSASMPPRQH